MADSAFAQPGLAPSEHKMTRGTRPANESTSRAFVSWFTGFCGSLLTVLAATGGARPFTDGAFAPLRALCPSLQNGDTPRASRMHPPGQAADRATPNNPAVQVLSEPLPPDAELGLRLTCHRFSSSAPYRFAETTGTFRAVASFRMNPAAADVWVEDGPTLSFRVTLEAADVLQAHVDQAAQSQ
jgi:hypothetical protein